MKKMPKLTPDMARVLKEMQSGKEVEYGTSMISSSRPWIVDSEQGHPHVRSSTLKGLLDRGLVEQRYAYPIGAVVLTKKGREYREAGE